MAVAKRSLRFAASALSRLAPFVPADAAPWVTVGATDDSYVLRFDDGTFELSRGGDVRYAEVRDEVFAHLLLDHVIPRLLSVRGSVALHATAVRHQGQILAFLGETGVGKSTMTLALQRRGAVVVADDCLRVELEDGAVLAYPGYPGLRVFPDVHDRFWIDAPPASILCDSEWGRDAE